MRRFITTSCLALLATFGCAAEEGDELAEAGASGADAAADSDRGPQGNGGGINDQKICDEKTHMVNLGGPFSCDAGPKTVKLMGAGKSFEIFKYEASHPLATANVAFPCAVSDGIGFQAPAVPTPACSAEGVRPWHSVSWDEAGAACAETGEGWRLCTLAELAHACEGPETSKYTWGDRWDAAKCNLREVYRGEGAERTSEAPTGEYPACKSADGVFDANGNLWEWVSDRHNDDPRKHTYIGAGWKIIAQRHDESVQTCRTETTVPGISGPTYSSGFVGFRCCRDQ